MLVSAVIIFFNAERFLEEAIESVLAQTYSDWELLLVDDGSSDAGTACARRYADRDPDRIRYLEHPGHVNLGMSAARNLGIEQARGEAPAFLDADDVWLPDKLERQVELLRAHPEADMVWGRTGYWFSWTGNPDDKQLDNVSVFPAGLGGLVKGAPLRAVCFQGAPPSNCAVLFRADFVRRIGGWESSFKGLFEDQVFWAKACAVGAAYIDDKCVARYRMHPDSSCCVALRESTYHNSRKGYLEWVEAYWRDLEIDTGPNASADPAAGLLARELLRYRRPWRFWWREVMARVSAAMRRYKMRSALTIRRGLRGFSSSGGKGARARITADPNPVPVSDCHASHRPRRLTTLSWRSDARLELRRGSPDGELVDAGSPGSNKKVRVWAEDGAEFYLQQVSDESDAPERRTVDTVRIRLRLLGKLVSPW